MSMIPKEQYPLFLAEIPEAEKETLCSRLEAQAVTLVEDTRGMVMMSATDCFDTPFHIGEVLVRQVRVELDGHAGIGIAMGDSYPDAFITAAAEAAAAAGNKRIAHEISQMIGDNARYMMAPSPIPRWDIPRLHRADALMLFGAGREKRIYAIPPHTNVEPIEFEDFPFRVEDFKGAACSECGSTDTFLDELIDRESGKKTWTCSDTFWCRHTRSNG